MNSFSSNTRVGDMIESSRHYVAVLEGVPNCNHGGGGITAFAAVKAMRERGNRVTVVSLSRDPKPGNDEKHIRELEQIGIAVRMVEAVKPARRRFSSVFPADESLFPGLLQRDKVRKVLVELSPDAVFMYHWNALAAVHGIREFPKFGTVGDPAHLPFLFRSSFLEAYEGKRSLKRKLTDFLRRSIMVPRLVRLQEEMLRECNARGAFAAHHAEMFSRSGNFDCLYLHTPTPDPEPPKRALDKAGKFKIMHIGHLQGIATLAGVELLAKTVLPELKRIMPPDSFEVHLVGGFFEAMPAELQQAMRDPCVVIRGQVTPADVEFLSSDVVLVPTPIELGIRVRIITAFSFGSCIVAHLANRKGIPELEHGVNAMLSDDGLALARLCKQLHEDCSLRVGLGAKARESYDSRFSLGAAGGSLCDTMDRLAGVDQRIMIG